MVIIPNDKGDHYAAVKKKCYLERPTPSQCVTSTVLNKPKGLMSVATKVIFLLFMLALISKHCLSRLLSR